MTVEYEKILEEAFRAGVRHALGRRKLKDGELETAYRDWKAGQLEEFPVNRLELSTRIVNLLEWAGIHTIGQLRAKMSEAGAGGDIWDVRGWGYRTYEQVVGALQLWDRGQRP